MRAAGLGAPRPLVPGSGSAVGATPSGSVSSGGRRSSVKAAVLTVEQVDRSVQTDAQDKPAPPVNGTASGASRRFLASAAGHRDSELLLARVRAELADDRPLVDHED